jgi:hypothetical protein
MSTRTIVEDCLWARIEDEADKFIIAHHSDLFHLLALILAYYQVRGTTPEQMVASDVLRQRIATVIADAEPIERTPEHTRGGIVMFSGHTPGNRSATLHRFSVKT